MQVRLPYLQNGDGMRQQTELPMVVSTEEMDDETFIVHFNKRHADQLPGLTCIMPGIDQRTLDMYRTFHGHLHRWLQMELPHAHR